MTVIIIITITPTITTVVAMLCYAMLCCAMLCYAVLWHAMLCYAMLWYAIFILLKQGKRKRYNWVDDPAKGRATPHGKSMDPIRKPFQYATGNRRLKAMRMAANLGWQGKGCYLFTM